MGAMSTLDTQITDALTKLDARGRRRQAKPLPPITDDMPLRRQVHLAKMGAPDHRTNYTTGNPIVTRGSVTEQTRDEKPGDGEASDDAE